MKPGTAFAMAAVAQILVLALVAALWPPKAAEGAVPIAIIASGVAGSLFPGPWYRVAVLGGALGLLNAVALLMLSNWFATPQKFPPVQGIVFSISFAAATATAAWLWAEFERQRDRK